MIKISLKGDFKNTERFFKNASSLKIKKILDKYGRKGVAALSSATPVDSGATASSWNYDISISKGSATITWTNSNVNDGVPIAILIQYGHVTRNGGYVKGIDYINPALKPIFEEFSNDIWGEVTKA